MQPLITIVTPTFNSSKHIEATLDSVLSQTYATWECILVDDGSTDHTEAIVKQYSDKDNRFQFHKRPESLPKGPSSARNFGVTKAKGDYLIFLDADDLLAATCLENRIQKFSEKQDCDFLVFQMERFLNEPDFSKKVKEVETDKNFVLESFLHLHGQWPITSPIYKTAFFKKIGFNQDLVVFEDLDVAIKAIVLAATFEIFDTVDCYYRNDENYKAKFNSPEVKSKMVKGFQKLLGSLIDLMKYNPEIHFKNSDIKSGIVGSYKKFFRYTILENSKAFKEDNKKIVHLLKTHSFLDNATAFKFFFVDNFLLPFANVKKSGISRVIKYMYQ